MPSVPDLDPDDWTAFRADAHRALDAMVDNLAALREQPAWRPMPTATRAFFETGLPREGRALPLILDDIAAHVTPFVSGNRHPAFMGWAQGAGTPIGMVADMIAGALNVNCGGRDHVGTAVERQITLWVAEAFGLPRTASGVFVTGASMANLLALAVARHQKIGADAAAGSRLVAYASCEAHDCIRKAMDLLGIGAARLRAIACDAERRIDLGALSAAIAADRADGLVPFALVGTAGTVNTGAIDPLDALASLVRREGLWFHVDGAFGALAAFSPALKPLVAGLERADSVAFDFHKWFHVPYDAGFLIVRDSEAHRATFASKPAYLAREPRGLAAGATWPCDFGIDLSRGFRALKTWMTIEAYGIDRLSGCMEQTCALARRLRDLVDASPILEMRAPVALNIACFGIVGDGDGRLAREIVLDLQESGEAVPSLTILDGRPTIRAAIMNHRTRADDIDRFVAAVEAGASMAAGPTRQRAAR